jgi:type III pantothenate kinase
MLLAIDVGNSHIVIGVYEGREIVHHWRINTNRNSTGDEIAALFQSLFTMERLSFSEISDVIIASVVPPMQSAWLTFTKKYLDKIPLFVDETIVSGIKILTDNPSEVGADRIVNSVAAFNKYKTSLIVVDFGTATTFDCVSKNGDYIGGIISPGLAISLDALGEKASKLPRIDISTPPPKVIGTSTVSAMKSGILYGYGSLVEGLIQLIKNEFTPEIPKVVSTGGMAGIIAPYAKSIETVEPLLTLDGLRILHERNR